MSKQNGNNDNKKKKGCLAMTLEKYLHETKCFVRRHRLFLVAVLFVVLCVYLCKKDDETTSTPQTVTELPVKLGPAELNVRTDADINDLRRVFNL